MKVTLAVVLAFPFRLAVETGGAEHPVDPVGVASGPNASSERKREVGFGRCDE